MLQTNEYPGLKQFLDQLNGGDLGSIRRSIGRNFFKLAPPAGEPGAADVVFEILSDVKAAFSDLNVTAKDLHDSDGLIRGKIILNGTHDGDLWGAPASGSAVSWTVDLLTRQDEDGYAFTFENLTLPDLLTIFRQIGLVNPPGQMDKPPLAPVAIPEFILKYLFTGQLADKPCSHLNVDTIKATHPDVAICRDCTARGDVWAALRMCVTCGYVGCCETSKNRHSKQHYLQTGHPLMRSIHMNESWVWCYQDDAFFSGRVLDRYQ